MDELIAVLNGYLTMLLSGFFTSIGVALACKALKWAPVNITVNVDKREVKV